MKLLTGSSLRNPYKLLHEGAEALARVEAAGIRVDMDYLGKAIHDTDAKVASMQAELKRDKIWKEWKRRFGRKANLSSRPQLGTVLFDMLGYESKERTAKSGRHKTDDEALSRLDIPFVKTLLRSEQFKKMASTYLRGIQRETVDGYLHPFFNLNTTVTYRSSSDGINFQNLPSRDEELMRLVRPCLIPRWYFGEIDYSAIEVRIAGCYNHDPVLESYIRDKSKDMHRDMAAECYLLPVKKVTKMIRWFAKNRFVFPQFYGSVYFQCAPALWDAADGLKLEDGTPLKKHLKSKGIKSLGKCDPKGRPAPGTFEHHIKKVEESFWGPKRFIVYKKWKESWWQEYLEKGYFTHLTGFRQDGLYSRNDVTNHAIQGSAFHCLLWSLIQVQKWLTRNKMKTKVVGQIHDSILLDIHPKELQDVLHTVKRIMTRDILKYWDWITVPLEVEVDVVVPGQSWADKKEWRLEDSVWKEAMKA